MEESVLALQHLFVLCCYGGAPSIDYYTTLSHRTNRAALLRMVDPTDWMASDLSGSLLNSTLHPQFLARHPELLNLVPKTANGIDLMACDLYNLTFSSAADENFFHRFHGVFVCRCPNGRFGRACEFNHDSPSSTSSLKSEFANTVSAITTSSTIHTVIRSNTVKPNTLSARNKTDRFLPLTPRIIERRSSDIVAINSTTIGATTVTTLRQRINTTSLKTLANREMSRTTTSFPSLSSLVILVASATAATTPSSHSNNSTGTILALQSTSNEGGSAPLPFTVYLVIFLGLILATVGCSRLMQGCFCDCFGGFKNPFLPAERYDAPINPTALNRCLEAVNAYEQREKDKFLAENRRPLILSVSENCPQYNPTVINAPSASMGMAPHGGLIGTLPYSSASQQKQQQQQQNRQAVGGDFRQQTRDLSHGNQAPNRTHSPPPSYHSSSGSLNVRT